MKGFSLGVAGVLAMLTAAPAFAVCGFNETLKNSGQDQLVCIDTDKNGQIDAETDCCLTGGVTVEEDMMPSTTSGVPLCLNAQQSDAVGQMEIVGCGDRTTYTGMATPRGAVIDSVFGEGVPGFNGLAVEGSEGSSSMMYGFGGQIIREVEVANAGGLIGTGVLCNAGGPAVQVVDINGMTFVSRFTPLISNQVKYLCTLAPIPLVGGGIEFLNVCTPVMPDSSSIISIVDGQVMETTMIPFADALQACGAASVAPTAGGFGLAALALTLLAGGTWFLRRRPAFAANLV